MLSPNTIKSRIFAIRRILDKYNLLITTHQLRIYFGNIETGELSSKRPMTGYVRGIASNRAKFAFGLKTGSADPIPFDNETVIAIKDLTTGVIVYRNPASKRLNLQVY